MNGEIDRFEVGNQLQYKTSFGNVESRSLRGWITPMTICPKCSSAVWAGPIDANTPVYCGLDCVTLFPFSDTAMTQRATGIYLQQELTFNEKWIVTLGGRHDRVTTDVEGSTESNTQTAFTKRAGVTYKAT